MNLLHTILYTQLNLVDNSKSNNIIAQSYIWFVYNMHFVPLTLHICPFKNQLYLAKETYLMVYPLQAVKDITKANTQYSANTFPTQYYCHFLTQKKKCHRHSHLVTKLPIPSCPQLLPCPMVYQNAFPHGTGTPRVPSYLSQGCIWFPSWPHTAKGH